MKMIARIWSGVTQAERGNEYHEYIKKTGIPGLTRTPGNRGVYVFCRSDNGEAHFMMISLRDSFEAIKAFSGDDVSQARLYPDDKDILVRYDSRVTHFEVLEFQQNKE